MSIDAVEVTSAGPEVPVITLSLYTYNYTPSNLIHAGIVNLLRESKRCIYIGPSEQLYIKTSAAPFTWESSVVSVAYLAQIPAAVGNVCCVFINPSTGVFRSSYVLNTIKLLKPASIVLLYYPKDDARLHEWVMAPSCNYAQLYKKRIFIKDSKNKTVIHTTLVLAQEGKKNAYDKLFAAR